MLCSGRFGIIEVHDFLKKACHQWKHLNIMKRYYEKDDANAPSGNYSGIGLRGLYKNEEYDQFYDKPGSRSGKKYGSQRQNYGDYRMGGHDAPRQSYGGRGVGQDNQPRRGRGGGRGIPPGLKGKEIGLYFRDLSRKKKQNQKNDTTNVQTVSLGARKEREISNIFGIKAHQASSTYRNEPRVNVTQGHLEKSHSFKAEGGNHRYGGASHSSSSYSNWRESSQGGEKQSTSSTNYVSSHLKIEATNLKEETKPIYMHAPIISTINATDFKPSSSNLKPNDVDSKPSTSDYKPYEKKDLKVEPDVCVIDSSSDDDAIDCKPIVLDNCSTGSGVAFPDFVDLDMEVEEQYSHLKDSIFKRKFLQSITGSIEANLDKALLRRSVLTQNNQLDDRLKAELLHKQANSKKYKVMMDFRQKLPSFQKRQEILDMVHQNQVVVISGETGCGKTTQVGQFILDDFILQGKGSTCHVVCTQPRRISATSVAQRVADERDEILGADSTGYQIRLERKIPRKQGSIIFCTTGVMLQWMLTDPGLTHISHLILDEIHERDVTSDFVITLLKAVILKRPDLKVILMSATLNAEQFSKYYGHCPFINIPGFTYPVKEYYLEDVLQMTQFEFPPPMNLNSGKKAWHKFLKNKKNDHGISDDFQDYVLPCVRHLESGGKYSKKVIDNLKNPMSEEINVDLIAELIYEICRSQGAGAILVFLPGWAQISKLNTLLEKSAFFNSSRFLIIPLHSLMPTTVQRSVFDRPPPGVRKIVLATNIAETSITIDDVVFVINCGKIKMKNFDVERNISTLKAEWVSLANARQRKGRAGRVQDGVCYHLYTKGREMTFANYPLPEMLRTTLEQVILQIKILQIGLVLPFLQRVMDPPDSRAVELSLKTLRMLNALDENENLTPLGYHLAKLPMDPQTGKMILMAAIFSCVDPVLCVAAGLNFKDPFVLPIGKESEVQKKKVDLANGSKSDHLVLAEAMWRWEEAETRGKAWEFCREYFLSNNTLKLLRDMKAQLAGYLHDMNFLSSSDPKAPDANLNSGNVNLVKAVICAGLYPNVAHIRVKQRKKKGPLVLLRTPEDGKVQLHIRSVNEKETHFESQFLLYHLKLKSSGIYLHDSTMVHPLPLLFFGEGVDFRITNGCEMIHVNEHIYFKCQESTANIVKLLRKKLDWILEDKISHPGMTNWSENSNEAVILREIIDIITTESDEDVIEIYDSN